MLRILIIEDSPVNMLLTVAILKHGGHAAVRAETATKGLALACSVQPDLILMDIELPDMDGLDATHLLRTNPLTSDIPIIALTAYSTRDAAELMREAGFDGYITKPIGHQQFLEEVASLMARTRIRHVQ